MAHNVAASLLRVALFIFAPESPSERNNCSAFYPKGGGCIHPALALLTPTATAVCLIVRRGTPALLRGVLGALLGGGLCVINRLERAGLRHRHDVVAGIDVMNV